MKWTEGIDKLGLGLYFLLCIFAIANIYSVDQKLGEKQLVFFCISVFVGLVIFVGRSKFFENMAGIIYIGGVLLLIGLFPFGKEILGQKNWYKFGSFTMQPVEFAKIGTALMLANFVSSPDFNIKNKKSIWTALAIIGIPAAVVLAIPDVGSMLVFIAFFIALYREGLSGLLFGIGFIFAGVFLISLAIPPIYVAVAVLVIAGVLIAMNYHRMSWDVISISGIAGSILILCGLAFGSPYILEKLPKHQRERIEVLYKGEKAFRDTSGYNLLYSKTAIGSGGIWEKDTVKDPLPKGNSFPNRKQIISFVP